MKIDDLEFEHPLDKGALTIIARLYKDYRCLDDLFVKKIYTYSAMYERCLTSRKMHTATESLTLNMLYWLGDLGISGSNSLRVVYAVSLCKHLGEENLSKLVINEREAIVRYIITNYHRLYQISVDYFLKKCDENVLKDLGWEKISEILNLNCFKHIICPTLWDKYERAKKHFIANKLYENN